MKGKVFDKLVLLVVGFLIGSCLAVGAGYVLYKSIKSNQSFRHQIKQKVKSFSLASFLPSGKKEFFASFEKEGDVNLFKTEGTVSARISQTNATHGKNSLLVKIDTGSSYPGIVWEVFGRHVQNWSGASDFHFDVYNNTETDAHMEIKFKSGRSYPKKSYTRSFKLTRLKQNHVSIPLSAIAEQCDINEMSGIKIFTKDPDTEMILYFDNIGIREATAGDKIAEEGVLLGEIEPRIHSPKNIKENHNIYVASSLDRIFKDGQTLVKPDIGTHASISQAVNEFESFQIVVEAGKKPLTGVFLEPSDLINEETGTKIEKEDIIWRVVGYVRTTKPYYPVKYVGLWPDPLLPGKPTKIAPGVSQPFWITVYTRRHTDPGIYKGKIRFRADGQEAQDIPLTVEVYDFTLPIESSLKTAFDFYPHITSRRYPQGEKESEEAYRGRIERINDKFILTMLEYRLNPVLNVDPTVDADLANVDRYRVMGLNNFSIGRRGGTFNNNWPKDEEGVNSLMMLYRTYGEMLKLNRMLRFTYIYTWDEGDIGNPIVAKICEMIHTAYKGLKNMVCYHGFWNPDKHPGWGDHIDIWCFHIDSFNEKKMRTLQERGMEMWMYVSGPKGTGSPNLAIDFDSMDYRIIPWLCWKYDIKGFLYWCVNWWRYVDPYKSAKNTKWNQNGNGLLFYPGQDNDDPVASLRLEVYRDGMEDYEYIQLLMKNLKILKGKGLEEKYKDYFDESLRLMIVDDEIAASMEEFNKDGIVLNERRNAIARQILKFKQLELQGQQDN